MSCSIFILCSFILFIQCITERSWILLTVPQQYMKTFADTCCSTSNIQMLVTYYYMNNLRLWNLFFRLFQIDSVLKYLWWYNDVLRFCKRDLNIFPPLLLSFHIWGRWAEECAWASQPPPLHRDVQGRVSWGGCVNAMLVLWEGLDSGRSAGVTVAVLHCDRLSPRGEGSW